LSGLILAGGRSRRYGKDKAFERLCGKPLIEYVIEALAPVAGDLFIVAGSTDDFSDYSGRLTVIADDVPGLGPLGGLDAGLKAAPDDYCFAAPCDSPFIDSSLIDYLLKTAAAADVDALIPRYEGRDHTVIAVYRKTCIPAIESSLSDGQFRISSIFSKVKIKFVDDDTINLFPGGKLSFFNINTAEDMAEAARILSERGS
jgi:molybdopterin-guanine dinucleotide biosynthesis protein A